MRQLLSFNIRKAVNGVMDSGYSLRLVRNDGLLYRVVVMPDLIRHP